jgi:non-heme chloroperoxidase
MMLAVSVSTALMSGQTSSPTDTSGHTVSFITAAPDVALEVLDWGGSGPALLLLAGLNNTAHVFDHFAHQFTARFHVVGLTRRGFGASSRPNASYDTETLTHDIMVVLDKIGIDHVMLMGHSIAGDEMTKFAGLFPARTGALVYLDAAYDRTTEPPPGLEPEQPVTDDDTASVERLNARFARVFGWRLPEGEIRAWAVVDSSGKVLRSTGSPDVSAKVLKGVERPAYEKLRAPALAFYARDDMRNIYPNSASFGKENSRRASDAIARFRPWQEASMAQFRREVPHGRVEMLTQGSHYVFLTNEAEIVRMTRAFLEEVSRVKPF